MPTRPSASEATARQVRAQCDRILASKVFALSRRQGAFLDYVVNAELEGRSDKLKEFTLGIDVFGKDESFDPNIDSIVRVEAGRLRARLREYYHEEGAGDALRIDIPKGHYVPVFHSVDDPGVKRSPAHNRYAWLGGGVAALAILFLMIDNYVLVEEEPTSIASTRTESPFGKLAAPSVIPNRKSIAILPFTNRSNDENDAFFVAGIHDDILTQLTKISSLKVISRTSMKQYRGTTKSMPQIGQELGVANIMEGSVQRAGGRVRINVQLIDAAADEHLWAETFDRELTTSNIFKIQSEIATAIADALHTTLSREEQQALVSIPTENLQAYEFFQRAQLIRRTLGLGSRKRVAQLFERAVSLDPNFALAHVKLADAYIDGYFTRERDKSDLALARAAIDKAFELSPGMPEAHIALSRYYYQGFLDYDRSIEQLDIAIPMVPGNAEAYAIRAFVLRRRGDVEDAVPDLLHAIELDPGNFSPTYVLAETYVILGLYEQAIAYYDKAVQLAPDNFGLRILRAYALTDLDIDSSALRDLTIDPVFADSSGSVTGEYRWKIAMSERNYDLAMDLIGLGQSDAVSSRTAFYPLDLMRGLTEFYLGDPDKATGYFESAKATLSTRTEDTAEDPRFFSALGFAFAGLGEKDKAVEAANTAYELHPVSKDAVDGPLYVLNYAMTYAMIGEDDAAIDKLDELLSRPSNWYATLNVILRDPAFENLHDVPSFNSLVEEHGTRD